jgi:hypothetical protein
MSKKEDIDSKKFEMPTIGDNLENVSHDDLKKAAISDSDQKVYDELHSKSGWDKVKAFGKKLIRGKNKIGQYVGLGLDAVESFLPGWVGRIRDTFKPKRHTKMNWIKNRLKEKSTWRGIVAFLTALGVSLSPDQATSVVTAGVALVGVFEAFFKDPQSEDAK